VRFGMYKCTKVLVRMDEYTNACVSEFFKYIEVMSLNHHV